MGHLLINDSFSTNLTSKVEVKPLRLRFGGEFIMHFGS